MAVSYNEEEELWWGWLEPPPKMLSWKGVLFSVPSPLHHGCYVGLDGGSRSPKNQTSDRSRSPIKWGCCCSSKDLVLIQGKGRKKQEHFFCFLLLLRFYIKNVKCKCATRTCFSRITFCWSLLFSWLMNSLVGSERRENKLLYAKKHWWGMGAVFPYLSTRVPLCAPLEPPKGFFYTTQLRPGKIWEIARSISSFRRRKSTCHFYTFFSWVWLSCR